MGLAVELAVVLVAGLAVGLAVELAVVLVAGVAVELDFEVLVGVVCPITCNTAIKQITTIVVAIRFIAGLPLDYPTAICRPMRALGAIAPAEGPRRFQIGPSATQDTADNYSTSGEPGKGTNVLGQD